MENRSNKILAFLICTFLITGVTKLYAQTYEEPIKYHANGKVRSEWIKTGKKKKAVTVGLKIFYENGRVKREILSGDGNKFLGNKTSIRKEYYPNGQLAAVGPARNIVLAEIGDWKHYYENGQLKEEGEYIGGVKAGVWKHYYENGQLKATGYYGLKVYDGANGDVSFVVSRNIEMPTQEFLENEIGMRDFGAYSNYKSLGVGKFGTPGIEITTGEWKYYNENGQLTEVGSFNKEGYKEGEWKTYYDNGQLKSEGRYGENGAIGMRQLGTGDKTGEWKYYDENGKLTKTENL